MSINLLFLACDHSLKLYICKITEECWESLCFLVDLWNITSIYSNF